MKEGWNKLMRRPANGKNVTLFIKVLLQLVKIGWTIEFRAMQNQSCHKYQITRIMPGFSIENDGLG
jgi:hypothetical protein